MADDNDDEREKEEEAFLSPTGFLSATRAAGGFLPSFHPG